MRQHVSLQAAAVRGHVAAQRALVSLLIGVQVCDVLFELHGVKRDEGAELTAELVRSRVSTAPVLQEERLVGAGEAALLAVVRTVRPVMSLHVRLVLKDGVAGVMATRHGFDPMSVRGVSQQVFTERTGEGASAVEAGRCSAAGLHLVRLHVRLQLPAQPEALTAGGTGEATAAACRLAAGVHGDEVAADGAPLHGSVFTQRAAVDFVARLPESVSAQLAAAGEAAAAGGTLQTGIRRMQAQVFLQVRACAEAAPTTGARVSAIDVFQVLWKVL